MATKKKSAANAAPKKRVAASNPKKSAPKKKVAAAKPKKAAPKKKLAAKPKKAAPKKKVAAKPKKAAPKKKVAAAKPKKAAPKKKLAAKPKKAAPTAKPKTTPKAAPKKAVAKATNGGQTKSRSPKKAEETPAEASRAVPEQTSPRRAPAAEKKQDALRLTALFSVSPERIYDAWLDAVEHGLLTGGAATGSPEVGGRHTAWDGYIEGTNVELERPSRIVQTWRTTEFPEDAEDSRLEITLVPEGDGTLLVLHHTSIPDGQGARYESGWETHYFEPMRKYFV